MGTKIKRLLSLMLVVAILFTTPVVSFAEETETAPALPTASVSKIENENLTFALNFKVNESTDAQLEYYGDWYADFELTVNKDVTFNADGTADGYLSGQYDEWSENWVNVPFENVTLKANETLRIMEYASELMNKTGLKYTYAEVYEGVKDFDCGVFFTEEFLKNNPDLVVTLELNMYDPEDESKKAVIGDTYEFKAEELTVPTATVTEIEKDDLTFALNFKADAVTDAQLGYFGDWYADFVLTVNKDTTFNANGGADGYLAGQYDEWSENWVYVPFENVTLKANESLHIMEYAAELMGKSGLKLTYNDVYSFVKDFDCGVYLTEAFLEANPDYKITLELKMFNPEDGTKNYAIGETYVYTAEQALAVAMNVNTNKLYGDITDALFEAAENETVVLLKDVNTNMVTIPENVTFDLGGYKLTTKYFSCFGNTVDNSDDKSGLLVVPSNRILMMETNAQLPIKSGEGYKFVDILTFNKKMMSESKFAFQPVFESTAHELLLSGKANTGVTINVRVSWKQNDGIRTQDFEYTDDFVAGFINSYVASEGKYAKMFTLELANADAFEDLTFTAVVTSDTGVKFDHRTM